MKPGFGLKDIPTLWRDYRFYRSLNSIVKKWEIVPHKTALLVLDMNYVCAHPDYGPAANLKRAGMLPRFFYERLDSTVIPNMQKLLAVFRQHHLKVIFTTMGAAQEDLSDLHYTWRRVYPKIGYHKSVPGNKEFEIREEVKPLPGETVLLKRSSGAFGSTNLQEVLAAAGADTLLIIGVESDCCIYNTAVEAVDRGFKTIVLNDACTCFTESGHKILLWIYGALFFVNVKDTAEVIQEIEKAVTSEAAPQPKTVHPG